MKPTRALLRPFKKAFLLGPFFKLMEAIHELLLPLIMAMIIDRGIDQGDTTLMLWLGILMGVLALLGYGYALICQYEATLAANGYGTALRQVLYDHILSLDAQTLRQQGAATLTTRMTSDINQMQQAVALWIRLAVRAPFIVLGSWVMALLIDLWMGFIFGLVILAIGLMLWFATVRTIPLYQGVQKTVDQLSLVVAQQSSGMRVIRAFNNQQREVTRFNHISKKVMDFLIRIGSINATINPLNYLWVNLGVILVLYTGAIRINAGVLTQGEVVALISYLTQMFLALVVVAMITLVFARALISAQRVDDVFALTSRQTKGVRKEPASDQEPVMQLSHVSFRYDTAGRNQLHDISLTLHEGVRLGVIGRSGSGKSTLVQCLNGMLKPQSGDVLYRGASLATYDRVWLRHRVVVLPQHATIYTGSIRENLCLGQPQASTQQLWAALKLAQADTFVQEKGLDEPLAEGGTNLSGGQRQRLALARGLVGQPDVLVLDDSFSALDNLTAAKIRHDLKASLPQLVQVIVSERIAPILDADQIVVMDKGTIIAQGKHEDLLVHCPLYREFARSQGLGGSDEKESH